MTPYHVMSREVDLSACACASRCAKTASHQMKVTTATLSYP